MPDCASLLAALGAPGADQPLPRTAVVVAHPDDESVGAGSRLPRLALARWVYVTAGVPANGHDAAMHGLALDAYAAVRWREAMAALALCGIDPDRVLNLGYADQGSALRLPDLAQELGHLFAAMGTQAVLTHAYEGGHPDHDATAFAVRAAAALLRRCGQAPPAVVEMTSYHLGPAGIRTGAFLPRPDADAPAPADTVTIQLTKEEQRRKRALFDCYATQRETLVYFPLDVERFRPSPAYDFLRPPHEGQLFYESHPWGMTAARFCGLAAQAMARLGLEGRL
jgi:N-acetylglucosamine malate deacetylase 2